MMKHLNFHLIILGLLISVASTAYADYYTFATIDVPGAIYGGVTGINDSGSIVGWHVVANNIRHRFIATPVPELSTMLFLGPE